MRGGFQPLLRQCPEGNGKYVDAGKQASGVRVVEEVGEGVPREPSDIFVGVRKTDWMQVEVDGLS